MVLSANFYNRLKGSSNSTLRMPSGTSKEILNMARKTLAADIGEIKPDESIYFFSKKEWSMPDLIDYVTTQFGPCALRLTSFSFTSPALVHIKNLIEIRQLTNVQFLLDKSVKNQKEKYQQLKAIDIDVAFLSCHAKVVLLHNSKINLVIVSSANINRNPRWEAGVIETRPAVFNFYSNSFNQTWQTAQKMIK
jgi:hypothetical protein